MNPSGPTDLRLSLRRTFSPQTSATLRWRLNFLARDGGGDDAGAADVGAESEEDEESEKEGEEEGASALARARAAGRRSAVAPHRPPRAQQLGLGVGLTVSRSLGASSFAEFLCVRSRESACVRACVRVCVCV